MLLRGEHEARRYHLRTKHGLCKDEIPPLSKDHVIPGSLAPYKRLKAPEQRPLITEARLQSRQARQKVDLGGTARVGRRDAKAILGGLPTGGSA